MATRERIVVVGAGQAGLSLSHQLGERGLEHLVLERGRTGQTWRDRWDSFCLVTPNWGVKLPGHPYLGEDPDGYLKRDAIVDYLEGYASSFSAPLREGVEVASLEAADGGGLLLRSPQGDIEAEVVALATGAYARPHRPPAAAGLPAFVHVIGADGYTNPGDLPEGTVLVVGSGQTGCQIAEEVRETGRDVVLACGKAGWVPRRLGGRDIFTWLADSPFFEQTLAELPTPAARLAANPQATGHGGGHDLHHRTLQTMGVRLAGRLAGVEEGAVHFAPDLADSVAFGDARYVDIRNMIEASAAAARTTMPEMPEPPPFDDHALDHLELSGLGAVIFTAGFRPDQAGWVHFPAFDDIGYPLHDDGASTVVPGLYFIGVHFLRKRKSSLLMGVGEDATIVADKIAARLAD